MANSLGSLLVSLGLDAAQFTTGLTKAEAQARKFSQSMQANVAAGIVKAQIALEALGAAGRTARELFVGLTEGAAKFKDLEESTGAAAESIASFAVAGATAGVGTESIADAMNKLTKNLVGVDDESKAAGAALGALGLNVKEFKELDPAAQYEAVGKALAKFSDEGAGGATKAAVAMALLGKQGAEQLRVFKALEEQGGRTAILTQRQIELADEYADKQAKTAATIRLYAQAIAADALPALTEFTKQLVDGAAAALDVDTAAGRLRASAAIKEWAYDQAEGAAQLIGDLKALGLAIAAVVASLEVMNASAKGAIAAANPYELVKGIVTGSSAVTEAVNEQRVAVNAAREAWEAYNNFDASGIAKRLQYLRTLSTVGSENDPRRGRGFVGPAAGPDKPRLRFDPGAANEAQALLKKSLDGQIKLIRDFAEQQKDAFDFAARVAQEFYTDGLNTLQANLEAQRFIRGAALSSLVDALDKEIAALEDYRHRAVKPEDRADADNKIAEASAKRAAAVVKAQQQESLASIQGARDIRALQEAYDDLAATVLQLRGADGAAAAVRIAKQVSDARRLIAQQGGDQGLADELNRRLRLAQQLTEAQSGYSRIVERQRDLEESLALDSQERGDTELETLRRLGESRQAALVQLKAMADAAAAIAKASGTPDAIRFAEQLGLALKRATAEADPLLQKIRDVGKEAGSTIASAFEDAAISGKRYIDVLHDLDRALTRILFRELVTKPFENYLSKTIGGNGQASGGGGLIGAFLSLFGGGSGAGGGYGAGYYGTADTANAFGALAGGGTAAPYSMNRVAENRPEVLDVNGEKFLLMGKQRGTVDPAPKLSGGAGTTQVITMNFHLAGPVDRRTQSQIGAEAARALAAASARDS